MLGLGKCLAGPRFSRYPRYTDTFASPALEQLFRVYLCCGTGARRRTKPIGPSRILAEFEFRLLLLLIDIPFPRSLSGADPL